MTTYDFLGNPIDRIDREPDDTHAPRRTYWRGLLYLIRYHHAKRCWLLISPTSVILAQRDTPEDLIDELENDTFGTAPNPQQFTRTYHPFRGGE